MNEWISFARKLKEQEQNGGGRIQSMLLSCSSFCHNVTDEVLEELGGVKNLKTLQIEFNVDITDVGINKFASIKRSISIRKSNCIRVSWYH